MKKITLLLITTISIYYFVSCSKSDSPTPQLPPPTITSFTPTTDTVGGQLIITGTNFSTAASDNVVKINGVLATVNFATATQLAVTIPSGVSGSCSITVTIADQTVTSASNVNIISSNQLLILGKWVYASWNGYDSVFVNRIVTHYHGSNPDSNYNYLIFTDSVVYYFHQTWGYGQSGAFYRDTVNYTIWDNNILLSYPSGTNNYSGTPFTYPAYQDTMTITSLTANSFTLSRNYHFKHFFDNTREVKQSIDSLMR